MRVKVVKLALSGLMAAGLVSASACGTVGGTVDGAADAADCKLPAGNSPCDAVYDLLRVGGWDNGMAATPAEDGSATAYTPSRAYTCHPYFAMPLDGKSYYLTKVAPQANSESAGLDILAAELPKAWKVNNLSQRQFNELVKVGLAAKDRKTGRSTPLSVKLAKICQPAKRGNIKDLVPEINTN